MKKKKHPEPKQGILTHQMDIGTEEFNEFQTVLLNKSKTQTASQKIRIELMALKFKMEDYLASEDIAIKTAGSFLKDILKATHIRQNKFAAYIGLQAPNLSKLINGERPISYEMAFIVGNIFGIDPMLWLNIQAKNEIKSLNLSRQKKYSLYSLDELIAS